MNEKMQNSTSRFSSRVDNYVRYRPGYPAEIVQRLHERCGLTPRSAVADVGSGTGTLSELFLRNGNTVFGVEPNREMRDAGVRLLRSYAGFTSVHGSAEATTLADCSVDIVSAGQAFHWFDREQSRTEFRRILKRDGWVVLVWNERRETTTQFARAYEQLLRTFGTDYTVVNHRNIDVDSLREFFARDFGMESMPSAQHFDFDGLQGRLLSSSYAPEEGHPGYAPMIAELRRIFERHAVQNMITIDYDTNVYFGHV